MARVELNPHELKDCMAQNNPNLYLESMLRKFKKQIIAEEKLEECRRRSFFLKKSLKRKEKSKRAKIRAIKANKKRK